MAGRGPEASEHTRRSEVFNKACSLHGSTKDLDLSQDSARSAPGEAGRVVVDCLRAAVHIDAARCEAIAVALVAHHAGAGVQARSEKFAVGVEVTFVRVIVAAIVLDHARAPREKVAVVAHASVRVGAGIGAGALLSARHFFAVVDFIADRAVAGVPSWAFGAAEGPRVEGSAGDAVEAWAFRAGV